VLLDHVLGLRYTHLMNSIEERRLQIGFYSSLHSDIAFIIIIVMTRTCVMYRVKWVFKISKR